MVFCIGLGMTVLWKNRERFFCINCRIEKYNEYDEERTAKKAGLVQTGI
jgi:hypothetical protein